MIGLGLLGQLTVQLLVANGCTVLATDLDEARRGLALTGGAVAVSAPDESFEALVTRVTGGRGADAVIITASTDSEGPIRQAGRISRDRGRVVVVGAVPVNVPRSPYYEKEVDVRFSRSYGPGRYDPTYEEGGHDYPIGYVRWTEQRNLEACLDLMSNGRLDVAPLISHRFPVEAAERAYEALTGAAPGLGILLEYDVAAPAAMPSTPAAPRGFVPGRLGVALVGPGAFAKNVLLPAIRAVPGVELRVAVAATGLSAQNMVERAGFAAASTNFDEMLADPTVDVVFISTRHHLHASQVVAGLRAGKHVFVEKPLCLTEEELDRIAAEYTAVGGGSGGGPLLMVGFNRRFAPLIEALTPLFAPRRRGLHIHYRVNAGQVPPTHWVHDPAVGGGRILGEGCHFIDTIASIAGADPARVMAAASGSDNCSAVITLADGSEATFQYISSGHPDVPKEYIEVMGEGVVAQIDDFRTLRAWTTQGERVSRLPAQDKGHRAEVAAFLDAVRRGGPAPIPAASLYSTTRATIRLVESAATGMPLEVSVRALREDAV